ncbi:MAG: translation initiation factor IF-2, partial [Lachnospiraceae bacterium]|nr:translation initiation factor IF-2 [Lachnospiraceae bacterium]
QELSEDELIPEDWGGSTIFVPVSAHTHEGIDDLLDMILLTADVLELKANPKRNVRGVVIEAELDKGRGVVATVLVQKGTLHVGDPVACGPCYGKVRAMTDEYGKHLKKAGPSTPVEIQGLSAVPTGGEIFMSFDSEKEAHSFAETFIAEEKKSLIDETRSRMSLDGLFTKIQEGKVKELDIIVKADVQGSVEAVKQSLEKLSNEEVVVKVIHGGVGAINESDVTLAAASNAVIIGFNVRPDAVAKQTADTQGVDIRLYNVIYNAIEDVEDAMKGMLEPVFEEKVTGHAEVRQIFKSSGVGNIAGSIVTDGTLERDSGARIFRGDDMIYEGKLISLKRFKDDVKEVKSGFECGLVFEGFGEFLEGDRIECYKMVEVPRS